VGKYNMTKLEDGSQYVMEVQLAGDTTCGDCDSLRHINYGDLFDIAANFQEYSDLNTFIFIWEFLAVDKYGHRWKLTMYGSPYDPEYCNYLREDSLKICFKMSNIYYYQEDGIPFWDTVFTHIGKKFE
jgi:hypothetical protein